MTSTQDYFPKQITLPSQLLRQVQNLKQNLAEKIQRGQIEFNKQQSTLKNKDKTDKILINQQYKKRIKQLDIIKQELSNKLKGLDAEEKQIKELTKKIQKQSNRAKLQKSVLTSQQKQKIIRIKKQQKEFDMLMKKKINDIIAKINQDQKQKQLQKSFKADIKRKQRLISLQRRRKRLKQSREKTVQALRKSQVTMKHNYSYLQNQLRDKKIQQERIKYTQMILKQKKQKMKVDFKQIKQHSAQFKKIIQQNKQTHLFQIKEDQIRKRAKTITYQSQFTKKVKKEKKLQIMQKMKSRNAKKQKRQRMNNFNQYLLQNFKPIVTQQSVFVPKKQSSPLQKLSHQQLYYKGNQYLQIAKKKAKKLSPTQNNTKQLQQQSKQERIQTSSTQKYPNYLTELRKNRKNDTKSIFQTVIKQKKISTRKVEQVIKWMKSKQQAQNIANGKKNNLHKQLQTAFKKVQILNSIYQNQQQII